MKKFVLIAALVAAFAAQPTWAAEKAKAKSASSCYTPSAIEAEEGIRYITDLMIVSSVCQDTVYAEFRLRNKDTIMGYQKTLIAHHHGAAGFDRWNTSLANAAAQKQGGNQQICQQSIALLKQAKGLDPQGFRAYASAQAAANTQIARCKK
jgi:hypothetical protein